MHIVIIRYKQYGEEYRDIAALRNSADAAKYIETLKAKYPSYQTGTFETSKIKYIR